MIDFERTHRMRRAICQALQQSQRSESQAAELSAEIAVKCKGELLFNLSAWLLGLNSAIALTATERKEIQDLTQMPLEKWIQLQSIALQTENDLKVANGKEKEALTLLQNHAPFGTVTKMLAGAESKTQIKALQDNVAAAQKHRESVSQALKKNVAERQRFGEMFFRDCLRQWDRLASTQALGKESGAILDRMTQETNAIWVGHLKQQTEDFDRIAKVFENLHEIYKAPPATPPQQHNVPHPQEQSDIHLEQGNSYDFREE